MALSKAEINERFYNTVGGAIVFDTEAQGFLHPLAVAKLIAAQARERGSRRLKLLELGANNGAFATSVLKLLTTLTLHGEVELERIEYFAVEFARRSLDVYVEQQEAQDDFQRITRGAAGTPLVATLTRLGPPQLDLHLVHADARTFVQGGSGTFDFVVLNELLDDLPGRVFYADDDGAVHELVAQAEEGGGTWRVEIAKREAPGVALPAGTLTVTSPEALAVVRGAASALPSGGMLLVHDYGFVEPYTPIEKYEQPPKSLPDFVTLELPPGSDRGFPRSFFRIFGSEESRVVQITTDVGFAELVAELEPNGRVITLPHGNALIRSRESREDLRKGDGVFLSEFALIEPGDDLEALLARLDAEQADLRAGYAERFLEGRSSVFSDLVYIKR